MNVLTIAGNLGKDARLNHIDGSDGPVAVCNFSVAVNERRGDQDVTLWVDCALWGKRAEGLAPYLTKGSKVTVTGQAGVDTYADADGYAVPKLTLRVNQVTLQGAPRDHDQAQGTRQQGERPRARPAPAPAAQTAPRVGATTPPAHLNDFDDDIPF